MSSIAFLHPDLGIGGAERLVVDAAVALQKCGHSVTIFTSHHDRNHCFEETKNNQLPVITAGRWIPRSTFGHFRAFWAYLRMIFLAWHVVNNYKFDLIICDQVSSCNPLLKWYQQKCLFYCHFPDQLLTTRKSLLKKIYRYPIDWFEEWTTGMADVILVNSQFTDEMFRKTFTSLRDVPTKVLYPTVNFVVFDKKITGTLDIKLNKVDTVFLSINRFERKKNLVLALESLKALYKELKAEDDRSRSSVHLIIAGGYDPINVENIEHFEELQSTAVRLGIERHVTFLKSPSDEQKQLLLHNCTAVLYTPQNEHFGIVPLEAMYMRRPVIATNTGGPRETVLHGDTGFLCSPHPDSFCHAMLKFVHDKSLSREMGLKGHQQVVNKFNYVNFKTQLNEIVTDLLPVQ